MFLQYFPIFLITVVNWLQTLYLYRRRQKILRFRRWHVKPHLREEMRTTYGAYETLFLYYANYDEEEFFKMNHMTVLQFQKLHLLIGPHLRKRSRRKPLPTELRLALTINYLANGDSQRTTSNFFRVGKSTMYSIVAEVCPLIWKHLSPVYLRWKTTAEWKIISEGFRVRWDFPNCLGALDGKEIRISAPPNSGSQYYNYKKFHSFKLLAICDAYYRFTWVDIGDYGSVSDVSTWKNTDLYHALERNNSNIPENSELPQSKVTLPYFFIGDAIFPIKKYLMKPFSKNDLTGERQKIFNYRVSRARNCIEDAFGILSEKWQILQRRLDFKVETSIAIVQALVCLHNFIINEELPLIDKNRQYCPPSSQYGNIDEDEDLNVEESCFEEAIDVREQLTNYFTSPAGRLR